MAPLSCASVSDLYGSNFGLSNEQIVQNTLKNNQQCAVENSKYQNNLKVNEIAGQANFKESYPKNTFGQQNGQDTNIPPVTKTNGHDENNLRTTNFPPNSAPQTVNNSTYARRLGFTNQHNNFPSNQGYSMFNRFQNLAGHTEFLASDSDCLQQLVSLMKELLLIAKVIMFILVLFFLIKLLDRRN